MKKLMLGSTLVTMMVLSSTPVFATLYVNQGDIDAANSVLTSINAFSASLGNASATATTIDQTGKTAENSLDTFANHKFSSVLGQSYSDAGQKLQKVGPSLKADIQKILVDVDASNNTAANADLVPYNKDVNTFNANLQNLNSAVDATNKTKKADSKNLGLLYSLILVAAIVVVVIIFVVKSKKHKKAATPVAPIQSQTLNVHFTAPSAATPMTPPADMPAAPEVATPIQLETSFTPSADPASPTPAETPVPTEETPGSDDSQTPPSGPVVG